MTVEEALALGVQQQQAGRLEAAEQIYRIILSEAPDQPDALHLLGTLACQTGRPELAIEMIGRAVAQDPGMPLFHLNLGNALQAAGRLAEAEQSFRAALDRLPGLAPAHYNLGNTLRLLGRNQEAIASYQCALRLDAGNAEAWSNLGALLLAEGRAADAIEACRQAIALKAEDAQAHLNLAHALRQQERLEEARAAYEQAIALDPANPHASVGLGITLKDQGKLEEAIALFERAAGADPACAEAYSNLAAARELNGEPEASREAYARALALKPKSAAARLGLVMAQVPILYAHEGEIPERRAAYRERLEALRDYYAAASKEERAAAAALAGFRQPFFLAYQGDNDRELQATYGKLICELMAERYPQWAAPPPMPPLAPGEPIRVGIVSGFFHNHSNWKIPIKGWAEQIDKRRFALFGYHTRARRDAQTEIAARSFRCFLQGPLPLEFWCELIRNDRLHMLLFPEIGMEPAALQLAALRLAPVQASSWGHPETSGLPTIDYFLSSDLMEPEDGERHYTERLIRLPNLSIYYEPPETPVIERSRADFGLREDAVVYWCCQSLFKYLPRHDEVFPRIALRVKASQFVFIRHKQEPVNRIFRARLERAFARHGLRWEDHVRMLDAMPAPEFEAAARVSDVFLDSIGWSGCNSTLESIGAGLPVVTLPGRTMRSRHSTAILRRIGIHETIASSEEEYVEIAAKLGQSREYRAGMAARIRDARERAYRDRAPVAALEEFLEAAARQRLMFFRSGR